MWKQTLMLALLVLLVSGCGLTLGKPSVTGTVTYRQRIALPPDAVVTVRVEDVSRADAPADLIGEQVIKTEGKQVPIPFTVAYDRADIEEGHRYNVGARIEDGSGKLLFISDTLIPVITGGKPTADIEIVVVPVGGSRAPSSDIVGIVWQWESLRDPSGQSDLDIEQPESYTLELRADGRYQIVADCNTGNGVYTLEDSSLSVKTGAMTRALCPPGSLSDRFVSLLGNVATYVLADGKLVLNLAVDAGDLTFVAGEAP